MILLMEDLLYICRIIEVRMMKKLVLIDGNSIANRAFYALPLLTNKQGIYTNATYGVAQIVMKILQDIKPDHILVAFDAGKVTFRHSDYAEYKGKRLKTPSELSGQFPLIKELLDALKIKHFELSGYEADDIIGTFAHMGAQAELETLIYTGDKDMLQLASDHVSIFLTRKGITEVEKFSPLEIKEKYNLIPDQIIDLKGLMGDASDNIPGVPGVGEKTALKLLHQYNSVENVLDHIEEISGKKLKENLSTYKEQALLSKQLATIFKEVPMEMKLEDVRYQGYKNEEALPFFSKLEFHSIIKRLDMSSNGSTAQESQAEIVYNLLDEEGNKEKWENIFTKRETLTLHVEVFSKQEDEKELVGISLTNGKEHLFITFEQLNEWEKLKDWLKDPIAHKWVYDGKGIEMALFWENIILKGVVFDLMLGVYLLNPSDGTVTLSDIAKANGHYDLPSDEVIYGKGAKKAMPAEDILREHIIRKTNLLHMLVPKIEQELRELDLYNLLIEIEMPLAKILATMEQTGVAIDIERLKQMGYEINQKLEELTKEIYDAAGTIFNINSPKQLGEVLFDKLQLPVLKKTKTSYSTSADVLEKLESKHPIISHILHFRQLGKLHSTYIEGLLKMVNSNTGKIHTSFNQAITATGRLSSTDPNLQNIPIRLEEGRKIRQAFTPSESDWVMLAADYSQVELRVLAHISKDKNLISAFLEDKDIHTKTAMDIFNVPEAEVSSLMRRQAKAVNFGIVYGISDYGLSQNLSISRKDAAVFIDKYFSVFSGVKAYMKDIVDQAKKEGYVTTLLNRRRYLPDIKSSNFNIRSFAERTAMNTPIQGSAADIIKIAMVDMAKNSKEKNLKSRLLLQVHDELIFEVHPDDLEALTVLVRDTMENAIKLDVPLKVDINTGKTWYEAK